MLRQRVAALASAVLGGMLITTGEQEGHPHQRRGPGVDEITKVPLGRGVHRHLRGVLSPL
jgi:hypothetical protein